MIPGSCHEVLYMRIELFLVIVQRIVVIPYGCFRTSYQSYLQGSRIEDGTDRLSQNVSNKLRLLAAQQPGRVQFSLSFLLHACQYLAEPSHFGAKLFLNCFQIHSLYSCSSHYFYKAKLLYSFMSILFKIIDLCLFSETLIYNSVPS